MALITIKEFFYYLINQICTVFHESMVSLGEYLTSRFHIIFRNLDSYRRYSLPGPNIHTTHNHRILIQNSWMSHHHLDFLIPGFHLAFMTRPYFPSTPSHDERDPTQTGLGTVNVGVHLMAFLAAKSRNVGGKFLGLIDRAVFCSCPWWSRIRTCGVLIMFLSQRCTFQGNCSHANKGRVQEKESNARK